MPHLVLLGDSVIDNGAYVGNGPRVLDQVRAALPPGWQVTQRAVDGHTTNQVKGQLAHLPRDATHFAVSVGGNDALGEIGVLQSGAATVGDALLQLGALADAFEREYRAMLGAVLARQLPTAVCSVYRPRFTDETLQYVAVAALAHFNDVILRVAFEHGLAVVDLRLIATEPEDYANEIEPSSVGGEKIARALVQAAITHEHARGRSAVYLG